MCPEPVEGQETRASTGSAHISGSLPGVPALPRCWDAEIVFVAFPQVDEAPDVVDEPVMFIRGVGAPHGVDEQPIEVRTVHPIKGDLVDVPESACAEVEVTLGLEVLICQDRSSRSAMSK